MKSASKPILLLLTIITLATAGCQTCSLSEEQFDKQCQGQQVDSKVGAIVAGIGTALYWGAMIGLLIANTK